MKKLLITIAIMLGLNGMAFAEDGLFQRGMNFEEEQMSFFFRNDNLPILPYQHNLYGNQDADAAPLGGGILTLIGFGAGYALAKKKKSE